MNCLWCDQEIVVEVGWENLVFCAKPRQLCVKCMGNLSLLTGRKCKRCSRRSEQKVCKDCKDWETTHGEDPLIANYSVFAYNLQMKEMIARWKYRGDYILADAFKEHYIHKFNESFPQGKKDMVIVPIPLSKERLYERGFNQAQQLADFLPGESKEIITRIHSEKQSKKTKNERIFTDNPFTILQGINKPVILVDDIYTTGTTLRHAATLLREKGCPAVYGYTLVR